MRLEPVADLFSPKRSALPARAPRPTGLADPAFRRMALGALVTIIFGFLLIQKGDAQFVMALSIAIVYGWGGCLWISARFPDPTERVFNRRWFLIAYVVKVLLALVIYYFMRDRIQYDAGTYERYGRLWAEYWRGNIHIAPVEYFASLHNYSVVVASMYYLTDTNELVPDITNCLIGALLVPVLYQTARDQFDAAAGRYAAILAAVVASWITWSAIAMRDILIIFFLTLVIRELLALARGVSGVRLLRLVLWLAGLTLMRPYMGLLLVVVTGCTLVFQLARHPLLRIGLGLGFIGLLALLFFHGGTQTILLDVIQSQTEQINGARQAMISNTNEDDRNWGLHESFHSINDITRFLPTATFYLLLGPFIWQYSLMHVILLIPELATWYALLFFGARGLLRLGTRRLLVPLLSFFLIGLIFYALISDDYAIAIRHRSQLDVPMILWASVGIPRRRPAFLDAKATA